MEKTYYSHSPEESRELARKLGEHAFPGAVLALWGDMGAGKTAFVHGLCQGLGLEVKYDNFLPPHIQGILSGVKATRSAISKYALCRRYH